MHHEATVNATFTNLKSDEAELRMSRTSPGRYACNEICAVKHTEKGVGLKEIYKFADVFS